MPPQTPQNDQSNGAGNPSDGVPAPYNPDTPVPTPGPAPAEPAQIEASPQPAAQSAPQAPPQVLPQSPIQSEPQAQPTQIQPQAQVFDGNAQPVQPAQTNPNVPVTPLAAPTVSGTGQPGAAVQASRKRFGKKQLIFGLAAVVVVIAVVVGAMTLLHKPAKNKASSSNSTQANNMSVKVPASWKRVDTGLGFSVSAPAGWSLGTPLSSDFNGLNDKSVPVSATGGAVPLGQTTQGQVDQSVNVGVENLDGDKTEAAFDNKVTKLSSDDAATLKALGVDTSKITVKSKSIEINGKPWLEVNSNIPGQYSDNLYYWNKDHAITLIVTNSSQAKVAQLSQSYLFPMAASLILK